MVTDPKIFQKAPIYTYFDGERAPKKRNYVKNERSKTAKIFNKFYLEYNFEGFRSGKSFENFDDVFFQRRRQIFETTGQKSRFWKILTKKSRFFGTRSPSKLVYIGAFRKILGSVTKNGFPLRRQGVKS